MNSSRLFPTATTRHLAAKRLLDQRSLIDGADPTFVWKWLRALLANPMGVEADTLEASQLAQLEARFLVHRNGVGRRPGLPLLFMSRRRLRL
jgi:hypothetical protein